MEAWYLIVIYALLFVGGAALAVWGFVKYDKRKITMSYFLEIIGLVASFVVYMVFSRMEGTEPIPGFTYLSQVLISMIGVAAFSGEIALTLIATVVYNFCKKKKDK